MDKKQLLKESRPVHDPKAFFSALVHQPMAFLCLCILTILVLGAIFIPFFSSFDYASQNLAFQNQPFFSPDPMTGEMHWFGTDKLGRDVFIRLWYSLRVSLTIACAVALIDCFIGVLFGGIAGYFGGWIDQMMMAVLEIISGIPYLLIVLLIMAVLPRGMGSIIIAYSLTGWTVMARLVRGQVIGLKEQDFIIATKAMGASPWRILTKHMLPNILGLIFVHITLDVPGVIFTEAFLSMLGLGIAPPYPSLGNMAAEGIAVFQLYPHELVASGGVLCMLMLSLNLLGDTLENLLDPKGRRAFIGKHKRKQKNPSQH